MILMMIVVVVRVLYGCLVFQMKVLVLVLYGSGSGSGSAWFSDILILSVLSGRVGGDDAVSAAFPLCAEQHGGAAF